MFDLWVLIWLFGSLEWAFYICVVFSDIPKCSLGSCVLYVWLLGVEFLWLVLPVLCFADVFWLVLYPKAVLPDLNSWDTK
jgi:hypothetical protein